MYVDHLLNSPRNPFELGLCLERIIKYGFSFWHSLWQPVLKGVYEIRESRIILCGIVRDKCITHVRSEIATTLIQLFKWLTKFPCKVVNSVKILLTLQMGPVKPIVL